jgi:hypothetical protein
MNANRKHLILVAGSAIVAAVVVYVAYRWYQARQGNQVGGLGTNLNSVAPELVGGSTGPSVGPALNTPITITLNEAATSTAAAEMPNNQMVPVNANTRTTLDMANPPSVGVVSPADNGGTQSVDTTGLDQLDQGADASADNTIDQGANV